MHEPRDITVRCTGSRFRWASFAATLGARACRSFETNDIVEHVSKRHFPLCGLDCFYRGKGQFKRFGAALPLHA